MKLIENVLFMDRVICLIKYFLVILCICFLDIRCKSKESKHIEYFKLVEDNSPLQNCLEVNTVLNLDTTIEIVLIDGNHDGNFFTTKNPKSDHNIPDLITITNRSNSQFSGTKLKDSILIKYYNNNFLIKLDIENRLGSIEKIDSTSKSFDVYFYDKLSNEKVYPLNSNKEINLLDCISKEYKYTIVKNWAPFCEPCIEQLAKINVDSCRNRNFDLIYLVDSIFAKDVSKYFNNSKLKELVYLCDYEKMENTVEFHGYPASIIFSNKGDYLKYCSFLPVEDIIKKYPN